MKLRIFVAVVAVVVAWFAGREFYRGTRGAGWSGAQTVAERAQSAEQVFNDSLTLQPGALVSVSGINGPVEIATTDGMTAEIRVENNVSDASQLENHKIIVERAANRLVVRGENRSGGFASLVRWLTGRGGGVTVRQRVALKVPRQVNVKASGVNGEVRVGEVEGTVKVSGVNGAVSVARATGRAEISGVNGAVSFAIARLADDGVRVSGVNGDIELRVAPDVNADVTVSGFGGSVDYNALKNLTVEDESRSKFEARIGEGGAPIRLSGIRGDIRLAGV